MLRIQRDLELDSQRNFKIKEETKIFDFLSRITANLDGLLNDSSHIVDRKRIAEIKEFILKITNLINAILNEREAPISGNETRRFKRLIQNYLEKTVFKIVLKPY